MQFTQSETYAILERRAEIALDKEGYDIGDVARKIADKLGRSAGEIQVIRYEAGKVSFRIDEDKCGDSVPLKFFY